MLTSFLTGTITNRLANQSTNQITICVYNVHHYFTILTVINNNTKIIFTNIPVRVRGHGGDNRVWRHRGEMPVLLLLHVSNTTE